MRNLSLFDYLRDYSAERIDLGWRIIYFFNSEIGYIYLRRFIRSPESLRR